MDDSVFKSILNGFEATRASLDRWLAFWTWLVVIGVAFELVFIVWDYIEEKSEWHKARTCGMIPSPSRPGRIKLIFELLSVALVVIGIVGELRVDAMLGKLETNIRETNERRVLQLQIEAGDAATSAHNAATDAGTAHTLAQGASDTAEAARKVAGEAQGKAVSANITAGKAEGKASTAGEKANELDRQLAATKTRLQAVEAESEWLEKKSRPRWQTLSMDEATISSKLRSAPTSSVYLQ